MKDDPGALEAELAQLRPRPPGGRLKTAIAAALSTSEAHPVAWWKFVTAAAATVTVAVGLWALLNRVEQPRRRAAVPPPAGEPAELRDDPAPTPQPHPAESDWPTPEQPFTPSPGRQRRIYRPFRVQTALLGYRDDGVVLTSHNRPVRRVSCQLLDRIEWKSMDGKRRIVVTKPRREVVLAGVTVL